MPLYNSIKKRKKICCNKIQIYFCHVLINFFRNSISLPFFPQFFYRNFWPATFRALQSTHLCTARIVYEFNLHNTIVQQPLFHHKKIYIVMNSILVHFHFLCFVIVFFFIWFSSYVRLFYSFVFVFCWCKCWIWIIQRLIYSIIKWLLIGWTWALMLMSRS